MAKKKIKQLLSQIEALEEAIQIEDEATPPEDRKIPSFVSFCQYLMIRKRGALEGEGLIPFDKSIWRKGQKRIAAYLVKRRKQRKHIRLLIHKSRQHSGISTIIEAFLFWLIHFHPEREGALAAHIDKGAETIFGNIHRFSQNLPAEWKKPLDSDKVMRQEIRYLSPHSSRIVAGTAGNPELFRSGYIPYCHISEYAFIQNPVAFMQATSPCFPKVNETWDHAIMIESTAKGSNDFHTRCKDAQENPASEWDFIFLSWKDEPLCRIPLEEGEKLTLSEELADFQKLYELDDEQMKWMVDTLANECGGSIEVFHQEFPVISELAFAYTGHPLFSRDKIKAAITEARDPVFRGEILFDSTNTHSTRLRPHPYGPLWIWWLPDPGETYQISVDVGEGVNADLTEIQVLRVGRDDSYEQVAMWRSNRIKPDDAGIVAFQLGCYYNYALIVPERNGPGANVCLVLRDGHTGAPQTSGGYPALYYRTRYDRQTKEKTKEMGFLTSRHNKGALLTRFASLFDKGKVKVNSRVSLEQMAGFAWDAEARKWVENYEDPITRLKNDDSIMSLGIGVFVASGDEQADDRRATGYIPQPKREEF